MVRLVMILLGADYLRERWRGLMAAGALSALIGVVAFVDALGGSVWFPVRLFAGLLCFEGLATIAVAWTGVGGQRMLRFLKGLAFCLSAGLVLSGYHNASFILSMIFATLFLVDALLQIATAWIVRYRTWRLAMAGGAFELAIAVFLYQPYPTHYEGTVEYCLGLGLMFGGWNVMLLAMRARRLASTPGACAAQDGKREATLGPGHALTVYVWTPLGMARTEARRRPFINRYIAAVDRNGVISTGHVALESPEGIYISLYPRVTLNRSTAEFVQILRASAENNVPGRFEPDYETDAQGGGEATLSLRIHNYDAARLARFWAHYRTDDHYNLTHRNCSTTVAQALEAALEGACARVWGSGGWLPFVRMLLMPELWVAAQLRKRGQTGAWTPGLTADYARALGLLADPRPVGWARMARLAFVQMRRSRRAWREEAAAARAETP